MSGFGQSPGQGSSVTAGPAGVYGRGDLQAAFNWLVNQPEHIRKQASDPDRLMTLYYRSSGRPDMIRTPETIRTTEITRTSESARIETEAPVSGQAFISDLRQINEALRQFDGPTAQATVHANMHATAHANTHAPTAHAPPVGGHYAVSPGVHAPPSASVAPAHQPPAYLTHSPQQHYMAPQAHMPPAPLTPSHYATPNYAASTGKMQHMINEVREKLNLSSDAEALNMLVTLGYRNLKPLLG